MRVVVQRAKNASVLVNDSITGQASYGLMLLVGFTKGDNEEIIKKMVQKIIKLRIFPDENGVMNKNVLEAEGTILSISQFTLYADTSKGNRPSYLHALNGEEAIILYQKFNEELKKFIHIETGVFGADMEVNFTNIGPTTILLEINN